MQVLFLKSISRKCVYSSVYPFHFYYVFPIISLVARIIVLFYNLLHVYPLGNLYPIKPILHFYFCFFI